jgi:hypothetical protein
VESKEKWTGHNSLVITKVGIVNCPELERRLNEDNVLRDWEWLSCPRILQDYSGPVVLVLSLY